MSNRGEGRGSESAGGPAPVEPLTKAQQQEFRALSDALSHAEKEGGYPAAAKVFEHSAAGGLVKNVLWRTHLEMAEIAKRHAAIDRVKQHLAQALEAQPQAVQVWMEACRTFEDLGDVPGCRRLLEQAMLNCHQPNDQLVPKLVRILERHGDHSALRALLGSLRREPQPPERLVRTIVEAIHFEVRAGNGGKAREVMSGLLQNMPHQGPVYIEACRVEGILGNTTAALAVAEAGVKACPKYGPLWFLLVKLAEKAYGAQAVREYAAYAVQSVCHELHWKFYFEVAAAFGRESDLPQMRRFVCAAAGRCPKHLRWKVWLLASRAELWADDGDQLGHDVVSAEAAATSRRLLERARVDAPVRVQALVAVERARMEEYIGDLSAARAALCDALEAHDWKVSLERIFMEARQGCFQEARDAALEALHLHPATGRLWSALIALEHSRLPSSKGGEDGDGVMATFRRAVEEVPKSGEVWCEGARVFMNPRGAHFSLRRARTCLELAVHLTPQYGDSFLELLRLRVLLQIAARMRADALAAGLLPQAGDGQSMGGGADDGAGCSAGGDATCRTAAPGPSAAACKGQALGLAVFVAQRICLQVAEALRAGSFDFGVGLDAFSSPAEEAAGCLSDGIGSSSSSPVPVQEQFSTGAPKVCFSQLELLCTYADPNYGLLWFWCRQNPLSTPREVMQEMRRVLSEDLLEGGALWPYAWAIAREVFAVPSAAELAAAATGVTMAAKASTASCDQESTLPSPDGCPGNAELSSSDFAHGALQVAHVFAQGGLSNLGVTQRQQLIFGSDILCA
eukprot:TRINITY_DN74232_c0_g1_i1.p1 TRINITY_DN74232_c0_g1~~TRINITY_DN74232_c0_g1_i1.p1  ORF type:complete len:879 (-),score=199.25 TRINITY_DN74232_c0_g1_i1:7-2400(-)